MIVGGAVKRHDTGISSTLAAAAIQTLSAESECGVCMCVCVCVRGCLV